MVDQQMKKTKAALMPMNSFVLKSGLNTLETMAHSQTIGRSEPPFIPISGKNQPMAANTNAIDSQSRRSV